MQYYKHQDYCYIVELAIITNTPQCLGRNVCSLKKYNFFKNFCPRDLMTKFHHRKDDKPYWTIDNVCQFDVLYTICSWLNI
jgi:hypothetical protein